MIRGIDVSENNGFVDWQAVKDSGVQFAIIRVGYGKNHLDSQFYNNVNGAINVGLKIGVYHYSYALDVPDAVREAQFVTHTLMDCGLDSSKLKMGVWFDMEDADGYKQKHGILDRDTITAICSKFISKLNEAGYSCGIYANLDWLQSKINTKALADYVPYWVAQWASKCDWPHAKMWQYTDKVPINGNLYDGNFFFENA